MKKTKAVVKFILAAIVGGFVALLVIGICIHYFNGGHASWISVVLWLGCTVLCGYLGATNDIAGLFDSHCSKKKHPVESGNRAHTIGIKQGLPEPHDAHDILETFCRIMHRIDVEMSPYCQNQGQASLHGGINGEGKGYVYFWYDKDHAGIDSVFHDIGYFSPSENDNQSSNSGWSIQKGVVHYNCHSITGYYEWTGYNTTYKQFGKVAAENTMQKMIKAVVHNEWPEARIVSYNGHFDTPSGEPLCFSIQITTISSA